MLNNKVLEQAVLQKLVLVASISIATKGAIL
jgi:hypothetical protein